MAYTAPYTRRKTWADFPTTTTPILAADLNAFEDFLVAGMIGDEAQGGTVPAPTPRTIWKFQPKDTNNAPFQWVIGGSTFNSVFDPVMFLGYNVTNGGGRVLTSQPSFRWNIEIDYLPSVGANHLVESYFEWVSADGTQQKRPIFWQFDKTTGDLISHEFRGRGWSFTDWVDAAGPQVLTIAEKSGAIAIIGHPSQTTDGSLQIVSQNSKPAWISLTGVHGALSINTNANQLWYFSVAGIPNFKLTESAASFGAGDTGQSATFLVQSTDAVKTAWSTLKTKKIAGQTKPLFLVTDESNVEYSRFNQNGYFVTRKTAAPADADLAAGDLAIWFDQTIGATKTMFKGKDSGGTVRTATIAMA